MNKQKKKTAAIYSLALCLLMGFIIFPQIADAETTGLSDVYMANQWQSTNPGNDSNNGATAATPVLTFERAKELIAPGGNIWIISTLPEIKDVQTWNFVDKPGVTIRRHNFGGTLIAITGSGSLTLKNITFDGTMTNSSGQATPEVTSNVLLSVQNNGSLLMDSGSIIKNNNSETMGSAVQLIDNASLILQSDAKIQNNKTATQSGAGVYAQTSVGNRIKLTVKDSATFTGNEADCGGAIYVGGPVDLDIQGGLFQNNTANYGGAICTLSTNNVNIKISGGVFKDNAAKQVGSYQGKGGAIHTASGATILGGRFENNSSTDYGGAISVKGTQDISVSGATFAGNTATTGADFFIDQVAMKAPGNFQFPNGIYLNSGKLLLTSKIENPVCFEAVEVSEDGKPVVQGSAYTLTHQDWLQVSSKTNNFFEFEMNNNQITKIANQSTKHVLSAFVPDGTGHWKKCTTTNCDYTTTKETHTFGPWIIDKEATATEEGSMHRDCSTCSYTETVQIPLIPHIHIASAGWSKDVNSHWNECMANDGVRMNEAAHTWDDGKITTAATHTQDGIKTLTCTVCSQIKTEIIPATGHTWSEMWSKDVDNHWHKCTENDGGVKDQAAHTPSAAATIHHSQNCTICGYEIAPKLPSKDVVLDDSTGAEAEYPDGSRFDDTIELIVTSQDKKVINHYKENIDKVAPGNAVAGLYDIKLLKNGITIQPDGRLKVSLRLTNKMKTMKNLQLIYIDDNGNVTIMPSKVNDGKITFITDHLGYYGVIGKEETAAAENSHNSLNKNTAETGDTSNIALWIVMLYASAGAILAVSLKRKKAGKIK